MFSDKDASIKKRIAASDAERSRCHWLPVAGTCDCPASASGWSSQLEMIPQNRLHPYAPLRVGEVLVANPCEDLTLKTNRNVVARGLPLQ